MTIADRMERIFTKRAGQKTALPHWRTALSPSLLLRPEERYSARLYLREATVTGLFPILLIVLFKVVVWVAVWHQFPWIFGPRYHKLLIGMLSHDGNYWLPYGLLFVLLFNFVLHFPSFYYWNRRAARLQRQPLEPPVAADTDPTVWPPAPTMPQ